MKKQQRASRMTDFIVDLEMRALYRLVEGLMYLVGDLGF